MKRILRNKDTGNFLTRYFKSFCHALNGFKYALIHEHNVIIMLLAVVVVVTAGLYYDIKTYEWLFCLFAFSSVLATEMINTALEALVDLVTEKYHPLAKIAKDTMSTASLIFCIASFIGAIIIFVPYIF